MAEKIVTAEVIKLYDNSDQEHPNINLLLDRDGTEVWAKCWKPEKMAGVDIGSTYDFAMQQSKDGKFWNITGLAQDSPDPFEAKADELDRAEGKVEAPRAQPPQAEKDTYWAKHFGNSKPKPEPLPRFDRDEERQTRIERQTVLKAAVELACATINAKSIDMSITDACAAHFEHLWRLLKGQETPVTEPDLYPDANESVTPPSAATRQPSLSDYGKFWEQAYDLVGLGVGPKALKEITKRLGAEPKELFAQGQSVDDVLKALKGGDSRDRPEDGL